MRSAEYVILEIQAPRTPVHKIGVLLLDLLSGRLYIRLRDDAAALAPAESRVLEPLAEDLAAKAVEIGGETLLVWLEDSLSNVLRITDRSRVAVDSFTCVLDRLYEQHVGKLKVLPFKTHLPLFSLRAAAGKFGEEQVVEEEAWVRAPEGLRLTDGMFVAHVTGRSMEPRIPDGSLNVFRAPLAGSRQNKIVLVELLAMHDEAARYTIKRYSSQKVQTAEDEWAHQSITLHPLNAEFEPLDLRDGEFRVIAEWLQVLE